MDIACDGFDIVKVFCGIFCLVNWLGLGTLGLILLVFANNDEIIDFHLIEVRLDEFRSPLFHEVWVIQDFLSLSFVHSFGKIWNKTHPLAFFHEIKFHFVDMLKLFEDPFFWFLPFKGFYGVKYMAYDSFDIFKALISQVDMNLKLRVTIVRIWSTRR